MANSSALAISSTALADTVQISLNDNSISISNGVVTNSLNGDLIKGGGIDLSMIGTGGKGSFTTFTTYRYLSSRVRIRTPDSSYYKIASARVLSTVFATGSSAGNVAGRKYVATIGYGADSFYSISGPGSVQALFYLTFSDVRVNGNIPTEAWLEIKASNISITEQKIQLIRLIFDEDSTTLPTDAMIDGTKPEWVDPGLPPRAAAIASNAAEKSKLSRKIKKLKKKIKKLSGSGNLTAIKKLKSNLKKLKKKLKLL